MKIKWIIRTVYLVFLVVLLEIIGSVLMSSFSKGSDFASNKQYKKIREMLISKNNQQTISKYIQVPYLTYIPNTGYVRDGLIQHNQSGYRGEEVPLKKNKKFRVLCLGGSTTYGTGVSNPKETYPAQLKELLESNKKFPQGVEVINAGVEAATSAEELIYYNLKFRYYQPDLVIIHSGGNDAMVFKDNSDFQLDYTNYRKQKFHFETVSTNIKWMFKSRFLSFILIHFIYSPMLYSSEDMFSNTGVKSLKIAHWTDSNLVNKKDSSGFYYNSFYQNHKQLLQNIQRDGAKVLDLTFGYDPLYYKEKGMSKIESNVDSNNNFILQICNELDVILIPYSYSSISKKDFWLDDCHLTKEGEMEKAKLIYKYILESNF